MRGAYLDHDKLTLEQEHAERRRFAFFTALSIIVALSEQ
jgi:hypothetical protein